MVKVTDVETFWSPELPLTAMVKVWLGVSVLVMGWWLLPVPPQETRLHVIKASTSSQAIRPATFLVLPPPATAMAIPITPKLGSQKAYRNGLRRVCRLRQAVPDGWLPDRLHVQSVVALVG